jgi:hypothetical protein
MKKIGKKLLLLVCSKSFSPSFSNYGKSIKLTKLLWVFLLSIVLSSCSNSKVRNCQKIQKIYLEIYEKTEANLSTQNPEQIKEVAQVFTSASTQVKELNIKDETLNQYGQQLAEIYQAYSDNTLNFLKAFQSKNSEQAISYKKEIDQNNQKVEEVINNVNNYCQSQ